MKVRLGWLTVAAVAFVLVAALSRVHGASRAERWLKPCEKQMLSNECRQEWKKVHWRTHAAQAVADARRENKPLLVFMFVGERGQKNASNI